MSWHVGRYPSFRYLEHGVFPSSSGIVNEQCFIRKEHKCGKMFGASKSCFIACPSDDDLDPILALMSEKLTKHGIEPSIAIKERAYGQDIFCTKICGKIIESRFCIAILDDSVRSGVSIPNPNVYYEYGLMTSLRKHIIPLQRDDLKLAFNIQSHDTIKYNPKNIDAELERGIRGAIKSSEAKDPEKASGTPLERTILRKLELAGFVAKGDKWFLSDVIEDTAFRGFGHEEKGLYAYMGKIDDQNDIQTYLDDLDIVIYRTDHKIAGMEAELSSAKERLKTLQREQTDTGIELPASYVPVGIPVQERYENQRIYRAIQSEAESIRELTDRLGLTETFYISFIVASEFSITKFQEQVEKKLALSPRYKPVFSKSGKMVFGEMIVNYGEAIR